jgi:tetratricopeptide (TPR) repeat protein
MLPLSNRIVVELIGYDGMSADQCDVRQSILRRRGQYDEAMRCIRAALAKNPEKAHTRGLLHVGLADICKKEGNWRKAETEVQTALIAAKEEAEKDPRQAVRIYRHCANIIDFVEQGDPIPGSQLRRKVKTLLQTVGAEDQLLKL